MSSFHWQRVEFIDALLTGSSHWFTGIFLALLIGFAYWREGSASPRNKLFVVVLGLAFFSEFALLQFAGGLQKILHRSMLGVDRRTSHAVRDILRLIWMVLQLGCRGLEAGFLVRLIFPQTPKVEECPPDYQHSTVSE